MSPFRIFGRTVLKDTESAAVSPASTGGSRPRPRKMMRLPIAAVLVTGLGTLMLLAVAGVLFLGLSSATQNTYALLNDKADLALAGTEVRVRNQFIPAQEMARFVAGLVERGELDPSADRRLQDTLRGALAAAPDVASVSYIHPDLTGVSANRVGGELHITRLNLKNRPELTEELRNAANRSTAVWSDPVWVPQGGTSFINLSHPVRRDGRYMGQVSVSVSMADLSRFLSTLFVEQGINAFVLYNRDHVLAHPSLQGPRFDFSKRTTNEPPLPRIDQVGDPALAALWTNGTPMEALKKRVEGRSVTVLGEQYLFLLRTMPGYGREDWTIGLAFRQSELTGEIERLYSTGLMGLGFMAVSVAIVLLIGRNLSRQIGRLAQAADEVRKFEFRNIPNLPDTRLKELAQAAAAFNAMVSGLRWFETYVPKALVLRLMDRIGVEGQFSSEEREVTVMFTDIRGFSRMAEHMGAADTAAMLNEHFTQLAACIEAEGGTVDKFIGDAIMAFWGAPDDQPDHAARALRAAHAIARRVHADNLKRVSKGRQPIRVRIGLHSGPVVVGNIGSESRINYTIVGDTVNVAARIEELASSLQGPAEVTVLASAATAFQGNGAAPLTCVGGYPLRGRGGPTEVWRINVDDEEPARPTSETKADAGKAEPEAGAVNGADGPPATPAGSGVDDKEKSDEKSVQEA